MNGFGLEANSVDRVSDSQKIFLQSKFVNFKSAVRFLYLFIPLFLHYLSISEKCPQLDELSMTSQYRVHASIQFKGIMSRDKIG
jgi:hypothetical protein